MSHIQKSEQIYHGCFTKNRDGTNKLIEKGKACITPTNNPFWKYPEDVHSGVRTRLQEKNQKKVKSREDYDKYFKQKDIQRWLEADDSEVVILKKSDEFYVGALIGAGFLILFIVNNRNILTDGRRYRRRLN